MRALSPPVLAQRWTDARMPRAEQDPEAAGADAAWYAMPSYNDNSDVQLRFVQGVIPLLSASLEHVWKSCGTGGDEGEEAPVEEPFVLVDYGSAEGRNSVAACSAALHELFATRASASGDDVAAGRSAAAGRAISITHVDLPDTAWTNLFRLAARAYAELPNVFYAAVGRSFYEQVLPAGSVHLAFSSTAVHWLSRIVNTPDTLSAHFSSDAVALAANAAIAEQALVRFLRMRARELRRGGRLVVTSLANDKSPHQSAMYPWLNAAVRELVEEGVLDAEQWRERGTLPRFHRTEAQFRAAFAQCSDELALVHLRMRVVNIGSSDVSEWPATVQLHVRLMTPLLPPLVRRVLGDAATEDEVGRVTDTLLRRCGAKLEQSEPAPMHFALADFVMERM